MMGVSSRAGRRILFLVSSMEGGGAERVAALLCNHWVEQGHEVTLMPTYSGRGECLYQLDDRVHLDYLADRVHSTNKSLGNQVRRFVTLRRLMRHEQPDIIVSFLTNVNVSALLAAVGLKLRVVVAERSYPPKMSLTWHLRWLRRLSYRLADVVVVQTEQGLVWLNESCPRSNGRVIANPVVCPVPGGTPTVLPEHWLSRNRLVILAVGRLEVEKGFGILIAAFSELESEFSGWDLVILGEGGERAQIELTVAEQGLFGRVHLPGQVGNIADWYDRADAFVMSSRFEGFPNALVEAMAHGLPAVSMDCDTGPRDIISESVDGMLVPVDSGHKGLALAMRQLMENESLRLEMGGRARAAGQRYSIARIGTLWDEALGLKEKSHV